MLKSKKSNLNSNIKGYIFHIKDIEIITNIVMKL